MIMPFEKPWYAKYGYDVEFVGHPLLDAIEQEGKTLMEPLPGADERPVVALLPGSRQQEIARMLPLMSEVARRYPTTASCWPPRLRYPMALTKSHLKNSPITVVKGRTYDVLHQAHGALVTSGTALGDGVVRRARSGVLQRQCPQCVDRQAPGGHQVHQPGEPDHGPRGGAGADQRTSRWTS